MKVGIVGFRGAGKSTLFAALSGGRGVGSGDPSKGQVAAVPDEDDERMRFLVDLWQPKKIVPLSVEIHDYPGMPPPGDPETTALKMSTVAEEVDGLVFVVRGFSTGDYFYPRPKPDPAADARDLVSELVLGDLEKALRREEKLAISVKKPTPRQEQDRRELALLTKVRAHLESAQPLKTLALAPDERVALKCFGFLTAKPWFLLVALSDEGGEVGGIEGPFDARDAVRVRLEKDLLDLLPEERQAFADDLGLTDFRLPGLLGRITRGLGMIRFYTAYEKEVHVWEVERDADVVTAAGRIHTDIARGFIRAEVTACDDVKRAGDMKAAKAAGATRMEGREYRMQDGDILHVRFSV